MTTREFIQREFGNANGKDKMCSSVYKDYEGNIYSYGHHYPLLFKVDGLTIRNTQGYSATTGKHIGWCYGFDAIDVEIPSGTYLKDITIDLLKEALIDKATALHMEMLRKKRTDTFVYECLERQFNKVQQNLRKVRDAE